MFETFYKMYTIILKKLLIIILIFFYLSCSKKNAVNEIGNTEVNISISLQNQSDHSGIFLKIVELDTFFISDSTGQFTLTYIPEGQYTLEIKYPYFKSRNFNIEIGNNKEINIDFELEQQLQFWIEPNLFSILLKDISNLGYLNISGLKLYATNIANEVVILRSTQGPPILLALLPLGFQWPNIPNIENRPDFCYEHLGWLGADNTLPYYEFNILPNDTLKFDLLIFSENIDCLKKGEYLLFSCISNQQEYPEYFTPDYFWVDTVTYIQPYSELNKTLLKKKSLFSPSKLIIK